MRYNLYTCRVCDIGGVKFAVLSRDDDGETMCPKCGSICDYEDTAEVIAETDKDG